MHPPRPLVPLRATPPSRRLVTALTAALAAAWLGACSSEPQPFDWTPPPVAVEPQVQLFDVRHGVAFETGRSVPSPFEEAALRRFVLQTATELADRVYVLATAPVAGSLPQDELIARQRQASVFRTLAALGIRAEPLQADAAGAEAIEIKVPVAVVVRRTLVTLPACPDWTGDPGANADNRPLRNWSCSTAANFGLMVVDPNDLLHGRPPAGASGEYLARSIDSYHKGRTRDLIRDVASAEIFPSAAPPSSGGGSGK